MIRFSLVLACALCVVGCKNGPTPCDAYQVARRAACDVCAAMPEDCPFEGLP
jgi:hypothetical protein